MVFASLLVGAVAIINCGLVVLISPTIQGSKVNDTLAFQKLKNEIIASQDKWDEYAKARATAKDKKWFRHPGIDVRGPERRDDPFWTHMRRFYVYDPLPTLQTLPTLNLPLLAIFGELDTPEGCEANVRASRQIMDEAGRRHYTVRVYPNRSHNLMEVPPDNPNE
jgi:pimeloyl-ACP methyl ester carboxylesterase